MTLQLARNSILALAAIALSSSIALAQQTPAPAAPAPPNASSPAAAPIERQPPADHLGPGMGHDQMRPGMMQGHGNFRDRAGIGASRGGPMAAAFQIAPPGMWWKNPAVVQRLTLTSEQTKKMDDIFQHSRLQLIDLKASVEKQQVLLEPMLSANPLDSAKAMVQIDKVAQSRADLEKAHARMLLGIRGVLTPDQWTKLNDRRGPGSLRPQGGPGAPLTTYPSTNGQIRLYKPLRGGGGLVPRTDNLVQPIDQP